MNKNKKTYTNTNANTKPNPHHTEFLIEEKVVELLKSKQYKISFAESMTGGLLASTIISVKGASDVIEQSFIVYSNKAKQNMLRVPYSIIKEFGVVSEQTAESMATNLHKLTKSEVCVSVTGFAEPAPGKTGCKVCAAYFIKNNKSNKPIVRTYMIPNSERNKVRKTATIQILYDLAILLK